MRKSSICKIVLMTFIILIILFGTKVFAFYNEDVINKVEYTQEYKEWLELSDEEKIYTVMPRKYAINEVNNRVSSSITLKLTSSNNLLSSNLSRYDLRDYINVAVRNQEATGQCWAFATNSALESNVEKITHQRSALYSARYTEYATSKTFLDGINSRGYNREVDTGGFSEIALGLYTSGKGPVLESDFPFENNSNKIRLDSIKNLKVQKQVKDYIRFPGIYKTYNNGKVTYKDSMDNIYTDREIEEIRNRIKEHIVNYGAIVSQTYAVGGSSADAKKYYSNPNNVYASKAYFCNRPSLIADHQITIIGWDDNYAVTNFNENYRPSTPGAYIVLNSWGTSFGENGVYYISYEDCIIERNMLGIELTTDIEYDNIYQHDELGNNYYISALTDMYGANVFEREQSNNNEMLTEISIASLANIKCDVFVNPKNGDLRSKNLIQVASNMELTNGYHTIKLKNPVSLTGDKFVVIVKYKLDASGVAYLGLEYADNNYWNTATSQKGQSYISRDLVNWDDLYEMANKTVIPDKPNLCIKAFSKSSSNPGQDNSGQDNPGQDNPGQDNPGQDNPGQDNPGQDNPTTKYFNINKFEHDDQYIYKIAPNTKMNELINNISTNMEYYIYDSKNQIVGQEQIISTGMKVQNATKTYKLVVLGDLNGDGRITLTDLVKAKLNSTGTKPLYDEFLKALDLNNDGKVTLTDLVNINLVYTNIKNI